MPGRIFFYVTHIIIYMKGFGRLLFCFIMVAAVCSCGEDDDRLPVAQQPNTEGINVNKNNASENSAYERLEFPRLKGGNSMVIVHSTADYGINFAVEWDYQKKSQRWSCYQMYAANSGGNVGRYNGDPQYPFDPKLPAEYYFDSDPFWRSGYDHGHIVPSADRQSTKEVNMQTFYLTNMQPQKNQFNAGLWAKMEQQVRDWNVSSFRDVLYVCKGGTIDKESQILETRPNGLIVPRYFFMAVLCKNAQGYKTMGFWVEHIDADHSHDQLAQYVVNIDELERFTGIDFFCNLVDEEEEKAESESRANIIKAWGVR